MKESGKETAEQQPLFLSEGEMTRNRYSETILLFFGIHTANAATLAYRKMTMEEGEKEKKKQRT